MKFRKRVVSKETYEAARVIDVNNDGILECARFSKAWVDVGLVREMR